MLRASYLLAVVLCLPTFARGAVLEVITEEGPPERRTVRMHALGWRPPQLGVADDYWAQTFTTPPGAATLSNIKFTLHSMIDPDAFGYDTTHDIKFRLLVTNDADPSVFQFRPTEVLFESLTLTSEYVPSPPSEESIQEFSVAIPNLPVTPGESYAFVLDAFSEFQTDAYGWRTATATDDGYRKGGFFSLPLERDANGIPIGDRAGHLASEWVGFDPKYNFDLQFRLKFAPVPEPASGLTMMWGLLAIGFGVAARRTCRFWGGGQARCTC